MIATGTWQVTSDLLAKARFTVSPKAEAVSALEALVKPSDPAARAFRAAHHEAFAAMPLVSPEGNGAGVSLVVCSGVSFGSGVGSGPGPSGRG